MLSRANLLGRLAFIPHRDLSQRSDKSNRDKQLKGEARVSSQGKRASATPPKLRRGIGFATCNFNNLYQYRRKLRIHQICRVLHRFDTQAPHHCFWRFHLAQWPTQLCNQTLSQTLGKPANSPKSSYTRTRTGFMSCGGAWEL